MFAWVPMSARSANPKRQLIGRSEILESLSQQVRRLRLERNLSLEDLSSISGVSTSFLSQLERGVANPSLISLTKIAGALSIPVGILFGEEGGSNSGIVRREKRKRLIPPNADLVYELVTPDLHRSFEVVWLEMAPGTNEQETPFQHEGEECLLVLEGQLKVTIGRDVYELESGDSITFPGDIPHWAENPGRTKSTIIFVVAPPAF